MQENFQGDTYEIDAHQCHIYNCFNNFFSFCNIKIAELKQIDCLTQWFLLVMKLTATDSYLEEIVIN